MEIPMKNSSVFIFSTIMLSLLFVNVRLYAAVIHVPADQPTIQSGIDIAENGDTILVANGVYKGNGNVNIDFKGKQITVKSQNGPESTIINCLRTPNTRGFIFQNHETNDAVLDGFTIRNGVHDQGGGIYCNDASPTIKNCVITENRAVAKQFHAQGGGGIYCFNSDSIIIACKITNNQAESTFGAGVFLDGTWKKDDVVLRETQSQSSLIDCSITENNGSGVFCFEFVNPVIKDCLVLRNSGRGIVYNSHARTNNPITNCRIKQNTGGGVKCNEYSVLKITDSIITQNTAEFGGGISCGPTASIEVYECVISDNIATQTGGGIDVVSTRGDAKISYCTITQNSASEKGGGIFVESETSFTLTDSILWDNNSGGTHAEVFVRINWAGTITFRSCDIKGGLKGIGHVADGERFIYEDNINANPLFLNPHKGDYRLKHNSPAAAMGAQAFLDRLYSVTSVGKKLLMWADLKRK